MTTATVTGADGFAGSHLVENLLEAGYDVIAMVRRTPVVNLVPHRNMRIVTADVMDYPSVQKACLHSDCVFHLAAISGIEETRRNQALSFESNTIGTMNVLNACAENRVRRMLYCSTCHVYGNQKVLPLTEDAVPNPNDIYSAGKYSGELLSRALMNMIPHLDVVVSRAFNHYGPRQREAWLLPSLITQAIRGSVIQIGASSPTRDFTYVSDVVDGYRLAVERGKRGQVYQFCSGTERSNEEVINEVVRIMDWKGEVKYSNPRSAEMMRSYGAFGKSFSLLGWYPKVGFVDGLRTTVKWWKGGCK
jgi:dTDP-glucose 4,6-dehydratase